MGVAKPFPKEFLQLGQRRPFELAAAATWDGAVFRALVFGIDEAFSVNGSELPQAHQLGPGHIDVKSMLWPMTYVACAASAMNSSMTWPSGKPSSCAGCGDAVNLGGIERNGESVWLHDAVSTGQEFALRSQLPRQLDQTRPVVAAGDGYSIPWQSRRLRVVD